LIENRDWYPDSTATGTPQTVGTREGTLATMQAITTCTEGVGFWATDQGSWNTSTSNPYGVQANGEDGVLYVCGASNDWNVAYTPYTYPHPLQGSIPEVPTVSLHLHVVQLAQTWWPIVGPLISLGIYFRKHLLTGMLTVVALSSTTMHALPLAQDKMKIVGRESAIKVLTIFNDLTRR
jgi:hypothetical protein